MTPSNVLLFVATATIAPSGPCKPVLNSCEIALVERLVDWRQANKECEVRLEGALTAEKTRVGLVQPILPKEEPHVESEPSVWVVSTGALILFSIGVIFGAKVVK